MTPTIFTFTWDIKCMSVEVFFNRWTEYFKESSISISLSCLQYHDLGRGIFCQDDTHKTGIIIIFEIISTYEVNIRNRCQCRYRHRVYDIINIDFMVYNWHVKTVIGYICRDSNSYQKTQKTKQSITGKIHYFTKTLKIS